MKELTDSEIEVLNDMLDEFRDRLGHHSDAELGWDASDIEAFGQLQDKVNEEAQLRKFWWAR